MRAKIGERGVSGCVVTPGTDWLYVCWHHSLCVGTTVFSLYLTIGR